MKKLLDSFQLNGRALTSQRLSFECLHTIVHLKTFESLEHFVQGNNQLDIKCLIDGVPSIYARIWTKLTLEGKCLFLLHPPSLALSFLPSFPPPVTLTPYPWNTSPILPLLPLSSLLALIYPWNNCLSFLGGRRRRQWGWSRKRVRSIRLRWRRGILSRGILFRNRDEWGGVR